MIRIGVTGGIGSGKSVVSKLLGAYGIPVYTADVECKRIMDTSASVRERLTAHFGETLYKDNALDRRHLAEIIFSSEASLQTVNSIVHPEVTADFDRWVRGLPASCSRCAMESAILFENGLENTVDVTLMVCAPIQLRLQRASLRDNVPCEEITKRMNRQWSDGRKAGLADYVIHNDGVQALIPQIENFLASL